MQGRSTNVTVEHGQCSTRENNTGGHNRTDILKQVAQNLYEPIVYASSKQRHLKSARKAYQCVRYQAQLVVLGQTMSW